MGIWSIQNVKCKCILIFCIVTSDLHTSQQHLACHISDLSSRKILSWYHLPLATDTRRKYFVYPFRAYDACICTRKQSIWVKSGIIHKSNLQLRFTIVFIYFIFLNRFYSDRACEDTSVISPVFRKWVLIIND